MKVDRRYIDLVHDLALKPNHLVLLQHEDENIVYGCSPCVSAWLATPTRPEDARFPSPRSIPVDVYLGLYWIGDRFTWNDLVLHSVPYVWHSPYDEVHTFKEFDGRTVDRELLRRWLSQNRSFASLTPLQLLDKFACVFLPPFRPLSPLLDESGSIRATFIPERRIEVFGLSLTFSGNVRISCSTVCVLHYPPILDDEPQEVVE